MKIFLYAVLAMLFFTFPSTSQEAKYSVKNAHSHNDYEQKNPFFEAYNQGFGSIEADVHLVNATLYVAHDAHEVKVGRTLQSLYLKPLAEKYRRNNRHIYPDKSHALVLLIDLKTGYQETLPALLKALKPYRNMLMPKGNVQVVISGNTPPPAQFADYPNYLYFDGRPENSYTPDQNKRLGMISQSFRKYSQWKGQGEIPEEDKARLQMVVDQVHSQNKRIRFWATPDTESAWRLMMDLNADYINTDSIQALSTFLQKP
jgi:hypothetical protein